MTINCLVCCSRDFSGTAVCSCIAQYSNPADQLYTYTRCLVCGAYCCCLCCPFVSAGKCVGGRVHVGGAVYVHPIRILFYDRRVIMCAVMLNSTSIFCEMFCRYFIWIVNNFTTCFWLSALSFHLAMYLSLLLETWFILFRLSCIWIEPNVCNCCANTNGNGGCCSSQGDTPQCVHLHFIFYFISFYLDGGDEGSLCYLLLWVRI